LPLAAGRHSECALKIVYWLAALALVSSAALHAADPDVAQADAQRKKPLQRCDQLKGDAELDCLKKAREHIVEARKKRESSAKTEESKLNEKGVQKDTSPQKK
jgi:hypothetical protein